MITEDYVSFETVKLLKEKGFDFPGKVWYAEYTSQFSGKKYNLLEFDNHNRFNEDYKFLFYVPTLQMAMKWLREVHHIYIQINLYLVPKGYGADIIHIDSMDTLAYVRKEDDSQYDTYEQACEAAIKYYLENLI